MRIWLRISCGCPCLHIGVGVAKRPVSSWLTGTPQSFVAAVFLAFFAITLLGGGSARPDVASLTIVRLAAVVLLAVTLALVPAVRLANARGALTFAGLAALLVTLQLVPLPPSVWESLPGRSRYAFDSAAGLGSIWRPLSLTPDLTINSLLSLIPPTVVALWARVGGASGRKVALYAIVAAALTSGALGLAQLATGADSPLRYYPITNADSAVGVFANRNHQGMFLAIVIPMVALWAGLEGKDDRESGITKSWVALGLAVFLMAMAGVTGSRGALLVAALTSIIAILIYWRLRLQWPRAKRTTTPHPAVTYLPIIAPLIVIALIAALSRTVAFQRLAATDPLDEQRAQWLKPLNEMVWTFAPVGAGFGSFDSLFRGFEPFDMLQVTYLNAAHNDLVQLVIEGGVGALALLGVFLIWWLSRTVALWRSADKSEAIAFGRLGSVMTGAIMLGSLFDYPLRTPLHAVVFAIAAAWMAHERLLALPTSKVGLPPSRD